MRRLPLLIVCCTVATFSLAQDVRPLDVRNMRSLYLPFLRMNPRGPILAERRSEWNFELSASNSTHFFRTGSRRVVEDYELERFNTVYRYGLGKGLDLGVEAGLLVRSGGFLDPLISIWHSLILFTDDGFRRAAPYGDVVVEIPGHRPYREAMGVSDLTVSLSKELNPRLLMTGSIKLPTGNDNEILGSGAVDIGGAVQWHVPVNHRMDWHFQTAWVGQGKSRQLPEARRQILQGAISFVYRQSLRDAFILQWQGETAALTTGVRTSDGKARMVSVAYRRQLTPNRALEVYLSEDGDWMSYAIPDLANLAPDLTLGVRYRLSF